MQATMQMTMHAAWRVLHMQCLDINILFSYRMTIHMKEKQEVDSQLGSKATPEKLRLTKD